MPGVTTVQPEPVGPAAAKFVFVAGRNIELAPIRTRIDFYGDRDRDWRPYRPEFDRAVGIIAQDAASAEGLHYEHTPLSEDIISRFREAEKTNTIVVIIVDPWTIHVESYKKFMLDYDKYNFLNCALLIVWNEDDDETKTSLDKLQQTTRKVLARSLLGNSGHIRARVVSAEQLQRELKALAHFPCSGPACHTPTATFANGSVGGNDALDDVAPSLGRAPRTERDPLRGHGGLRHEATSNHGPLPGLPASVQLCPLSVRAPHR
jgi:FxsC-like protein